MAAHYIGPFSFQFWRSPPPGTVHMQGEPHSRAGVNGISHVRTGRRGKQFEAVTEEDFVSYAYAMSFTPLYSDLPHNGLVVVTYNYINYLSAFSHMYHIDSLEIVECKACPRLVGPNYNYPGGARMTVRWMMTPHYFGN
jgi:hypothetical protein